MQRQITRKWRPSLALVVASVIAVVLALPFVGFIFFRIFATQLIQQTEEALWTQAAVLAAAYAESYGAHASTKRFDPLVPTLSLGTTPVLDPRPAGRETAQEPDPIYVAIAPRLTRVAEAAQVQTLVGYRLLDHQGIVVAGSAEIGLSLEHIAEVRSALRDERRSVLRRRDDPLGRSAEVTFGPGANLRVYVALPVIERGGRVVGAIYLSRTPQNIWRFFWGERVMILRAALFTLGAALFVGFLFRRLITRPIRGLIGRAEALRDGGTEALEPLAHYGTREVQQLGESYLSMARTLSDRQDSIETFTTHVTHELKSPLTAIRGAAELMADNPDTMKPADRERFVSAILSETDRMTDLLERLRELTRARAPVTRGTTTLRTVLNEMVMPGDLALDVVGEAEKIPLSAAALDMILSQFAANSARHGATKLRLAASSREGRLHLEVTDDGPGIGAAHAARIFEPFFTTARDEGGTGMGLSIVRETVRTAGGDVTLAPTANGTRFDIVF